MKNISQFVAVWKCIEFGVRLVYLLREQVGVINENT